MNDRHAFHAGNHGDVLKHLVLIAVLEALSRKDAPWFALDTHAGRARYDLEGIEARRGGEADAGIRRVAAAHDLPPLASRRRRISRHSTPHPHRSSQWQRPQRRRWWRPA